MPTYRRWYPAFGFLFLAGCVAPDSAALTAPDELAPALTRAAEPTAVHWVHRAPHAPPFKNEVAQLVARQGQASEATLSFADGKPFARLRVSPESLQDATLHGVALPAGEAVTISLRRVDASRYLVELLPAGLQFNPIAPAELVFYYDNAVVTASEVVGVWKQDRRGQAWQGTEHEDDRGRRMMRARVKDFTVYAMGYNRAARAE